MTNAVRMVNGGTIQVRTGVLQGIGPQGPRGIEGPAGPQGDQGPLGEVGPMGQILQYGSRARVSSTTSLGPDTDVNVAFATVDYDDNSCIASSTNLTFNTTGDYLLSVYLRFDLGSDSVGDGHRSVWFNSTTNGVIARNGVIAVADEATYISLSHPWRVTVAGETINIKARSGDNVSVGVSAGAISVVRVGSGPKGDIGAAGPTGPIGPQGVPGAQGPAGNASSGFLRYDDLY